MSELSGPTGSAQLELGDAIAGGVVGAVVFDTLGLPNTRRAAQAMSQVAIVAALGRAWVELRGAYMAEAPEPGTPLDSIEVLYLVGKFYGAFGAAPFDITKVERERWSDLAGAAEVIHDALSEIS